MRRSFRQSKLELTVAGSFAVYCALSCSPLLAADSAEAAGPAPDRSEVSGESEAPGSAEPSAGAPEEPAEVPQIAGEMSEATRIGMWTKCWRARRKSLRPSLPPTHKFSRRCAHDWTHGMLPFLAFDSMSLWRRGPTGVEFEDPDDPFSESFERHGTA